MDEKATENNTTYSKKILNKKAFNQEPIKDNLSSNKKSMKDSCQEINATEYFSQPNTFKNKKMENESKIQKISKILQEYKDNHSKKPNISKEKPKKKHDKHFEEKKNESLRSSQDSPRWKNDYLRNGDRDYSKDAIDTIIKEEKDENFLTNNTILNELESTLTKKKPVKSKSGINGLKNKANILEINSNIPNNPKSRKSPSPTPLCQNSSVPNGLTYDRKQKLNRQELSFKRNEEEMKNIINIEVSFDEKDNKEGKVYEEETFHLRDNSNPSKVLNSSKINWKPKPSQNVEKLHDKLKVNVEKFLKRHRFSAVLMGVKELEGKSPEDYLKQIRSHLKNENKNSEQNEENLQKLIDEFMIKQIENQPKKENYDSNLPSLSKDVSKLNCIKKSSYDSCKPPSRSKTPVGISNNYISKSPVSSNINIFNKKENKPSEKRKNNLIGIENNNTLVESSNNPEKVKNIKGSDKIVSELINLNCLSLNTETIKKHILEQSKSNNNKLAKMKISAKISDAPSCDIELTPIPTKNEWKGYKSEREEYNQAARAAVLLRRLEYSTKLQNAKTEKYIEEIYVQLLYEAKIIQIQRWFRNSLKKRRSSTLKEEDNGLLKEKMESIFDLIKKRVRHFVMMKISEFYNSDQVSENNQELENSTVTVDKEEENKEVEITISKLIFLQNQIRTFLLRQRKKKILFRKILYKIFKKNINPCFKHIKNRGKMINKLVFIQKFFRGNAYRRNIVINKECPHPLVKVFLKYRTNERYVRIKDIFFKFIRRIKFLKIFPLIRSHFNGLFNSLLPIYYTKILEKYFKKWKSSYKRSRRVCTMVLLSFGKIMKDIFFNRFMKNLLIVPMDRDLKRIKLKTFVNLVSKRVNMLILFNLKENNNQIISRTETYVKTSLLLIKIFSRIIQNNQYSLLLYLSNKSKTNQLKRHSLKSILLANSRNKHLVIVAAFNYWREKIKEINSFYDESSKYWFKTLQFQVVGKMLKEKRISLLSDIVGKKNSILFSKLKKKYLQWRDEEKIKLQFYVTLNSFSSRIFISSLKKLGKEYNLFGKPRKKKSIFGIISK